MKNKSLLLFFLTVVCFIASIDCLFSQQMEDVPDLPEEIRVLPDSFKEEYTADAYDYVETVSGTSRFSKWIRDKISGWFDLDTKRASSIFSILQLVFYALVILIVIYIIVRIILNKEIRWIFKRRKEEDNTLSFEIGENIQEVDFNTLITEAVANKDYRAAIRYYYLLLLKKLDQFDVVEFDAQKTAYDYQLEVDGSEYASGFSKATYYYTYIWYGGFLIDEEEYGKTSNVFHKLIKQFKA